MVDLRQKIRVEVELTPEQVRLIDDAVQEGQFGSRAEAVVHAIDEWQSSMTGYELTDEEIRRLWDEGIASGDPIPAEEVFQRLRERIAKRLGPE